MKSGPSAAGVVEHHTAFPPRVQQVFEAFDAFRIHHGRVDEHAAAEEWRHHNGPALGVQILDGAAPPLLGVLDLGQDESRLREVQRPHGQERGENLGAAANVHVPEVLARVSLVLNPGRDLRAARAPRVHGDAVFGLEGCDERLSYLAARWDDHGHLALGLGGGHHPIPFCSDWVNGRARGTGPGRGGRRARENRDHRQNAQPDPLHRTLRSKTWQVNARAVVSPTPQRGPSPTGWIICHPEPAKDPFPRTWHGSFAGSG